MFRLTLEEGGVFTSCEIRTIHQVPEWKRVLRYIRALVFDRMHVGRVYLFLN